MEGSFFVVKLFVLRIKSMSGAIRKAKAWLAVLMVALASVPLVLAEPDANKTSNWSLESWRSAYGYYQGYPLQVPSNWHKFTQSGTEPRFMKDTEYADLFSDLGAIDRHIEGNYSQNFWLGHPFTAGIYQQVAVDEGTPYAAKSWMLTVYRTSASQTHDRMWKQVGIDPYGGTDPSSPDVIWGEADGRDVKYVDVRTAAVARSSTITLFARVVSDDDVYQDWNAAWMDAIVLAQAPTVSASSPAYSASPEFVVSWNNAQPAPDGDLTGQYDVQYKDGVDGEWQEWKNKKSSTQDTFPYGTIGHTYCFRARTWQEYDPEGIELHGAYSEEGDTCTVVGRQVAGRVLGTAGETISGANVMISGTSTSMVTDGSGEYQLVVPGVGSYALTATVNGRTIPGVPFTVDSGTLFVPITLTVRPADDAIVDGDFEGSLESAWTVSGSPSPQTQEAQVRSGSRSLQLRDSAAAGQSHIQQSVTVDGMYQPRLSFYAKIPQIGSGDHVLVVRSAPGPTTVLLTLDEPYPDWALFSVPLGVEEEYSGPLEVFFQAEQAGTDTMQVYLDEVGIGHTLGGPIKNCAPAVFK